MYDEPNFLLQREVTEIGSYFSLIKTIAAGNQKMSKIAASLECKQTGLTKYLKTLIGLDILEREVPVTEENPERSKRGLYKIKDNFISFWFRFLYPNLSYLESGHTDLVLSKIHQHLVDRQISYVYEDICREKMWQLNHSQNWPFYFSKVGRWWDNENNEIDIVALDPDDNNLILGECKYWNQTVGLNVLTALEQKAKFVDWHKHNRKVWYVLFSINGFTEDLKELAKTREDLRLLR